MLAEASVGTISDAGLALAIMVWQGIHLSWGNILYEQIKLELMKKHGKGVLTLYSIPYITYLTSPSREEAESQPPVSTINLSTVVQPVPTPVKPPLTTHLIQEGKQSNIPGPSQPKKRKRANPMLEEEVLAEEEVEIPPYKFSHIPKTMLHRDSYWRTYLNVAPEETLSQFEQAAAVQDVGARLQASAIREREARSMILEGMKRESQYKKEVVELKLSLSNMTRLNETLSKEQGAEAKASQKKQDELKQNFQAVSEECGKLSGLNAELKKRLDEADQTQAMVIDSGSTKEAEDRLQDLQSQVDTLAKEKATLEVKLQDQVALQREIEGLKRQKAQMQGRLKEDDTRKVQIPDLQSQVDALKQQRAELQTQHQSIEVGLRAELAQVSTVAKMVPVVKDNHAGKVEQLKVELTVAYGQQKRLKMQCEDEAVKIEKLR